MKNILFAASFFAILAMAPSASADMENSKRIDMDHDGYKEAYALYSGKNITKMFLDSNKDGRYESVIYYKNGSRDRAESDTNGDGQTDLWVYYYAGTVWKTAEDLNHDGKPDYWAYYKDGKVYRWEQDRNGDGRPDVRTTYEPGKGGKQQNLSQQSYDNDSDGVFETLSGLTAAKRPSAIPHSLAEALLR